MDLGVTISVTSQDLKLRMSRKQKEGGSDYRGPWVLGRKSQCDSGGSELPAGSSGAVGRSAQDQNGVKGKRIWSEGSQDALTSVTVPPHPQVMILNEGV